MKRFLCLVMCLALAFCFTACGKKSGEEKHGVDIEYYAKLGQISDLDFKLGQDVDEAKEKLSATEDEDGNSLYFDYESGEYTVMTDGTVCCCYKTEEPEAGITHIVKYGDAYGFEAGSVSVQVRDAMSKMGFDAQERDAKNGELFFLPSGSTLTVLEYGFEENVILFAFEENALSTTVIYKK